ncbi:hypothetical protein QJS83_03265 [Bdellovibrio sp. 22V]|uniref:hypothetical protein n=1 Tax=Bdellovibrio TaxID=958 RepID=UPI00254347F4|nr:hypothetical protein [Bdellovibrio sp. 22V]WII72889.1 hypothetical protein QJS83_03265 [Bdellovibrio sp. 22V]
MRYLLSLFLLVLSACASYEVTPSGRTIKTADDYMKVIERYSDSERRYSGFYNTLDIEATLLNSKIAQAQLEQNQMLYQWDDARFNEKKAEYETRLSRETELFLSFYTPDRKNDDLSKTNTMWKIFLDVDGRRYEGKAKKIKLQLAEIEGMYPYHNRFYTPYSVIFPVPMRTIENKPIKVTVTGVIGSGTLEFNP